MKLVIDCYIIETGVVFHEEIYCIGTKGIQRLLEYYKIKEASNELVILYAGAKVNDDVCTLPFVPVVDRSKGGDGI